MLATRAGDSAGRRSGSPAADELNLWLQPYPAPLPHLPLGHVHQRLHVGRARAALVDDEVGVSIRDTRAPRARALEPGPLDQPAGEVAAGVLEDGAGAGIALRLAGEPPTACLVHARPHRARVVAREREDDRRDDEAPRHLRPAIAKPERGTAQLDALAVRQHPLD